MNRRRWTVVVALALMALGAGSCGEDPEAAGPAVDSLTVGEHDAPRPVSIDESIQGRRLVGRTDSGDVVAASIAEPFEPSIGFDLPQRWRAERAWLRDGLPVVIVRDCRDEQECADSPPLRLLVAVAAGDRHRWRDLGRLAPDAAYVTVTPDGLLLSGPGPAVTFVDLDSGDRTEVDLPDGRDLLWACADHRSEALVLTVDPAVSDAEGEGATERSFGLALVSVEGARPVEWPVDADPLPRCSGADLVLFTGGQRVASRFDRARGELVEVGVVPEEVGAPFDVLYSETGVSVGGATGAVAHLEEDEPATIRSLPPEIVARTDSRPVAFDGDSTYAFLDGSTSPATVVRVPLGSG